MKFVLAMSALLFSVAASATQMPQIKSAVVCASDKYLDSAIGALNEKLLKGSFVTQKNAEQAPVALSNVNSVSAPAIDSNQWQGYTVCVTVTGTVAK